MAEKRVLSLCIYKCAILRSCNRDTKKSYCSQRITWLGTTSGPSEFSKFAKLMRLILENSRTDFIDIETEISTLEHYLELQKLRFPNLFNYTIFADPKVDTELTLIPPMLAQPFIENSIEHGMANMSSLGNINISFKQENNYIIYSIEDDGIGIKQSKELKRIKEEEHRSLATRITRERVLSFNKTNNSKISLEIHDLQDITPDKSGTIVSFKIPLMLK